jgi:tetratricopeptide (TPR) repeat protein
MNQEFVHLRRYTVIFAIIVFWGISLLISNIGGTFSFTIFLINPPLWISLFAFIFYSDKIILTQTGITKKVFVFNEYLAYKDIISIEETNSKIVLIGRNNRIGISRQMESFAELYGFLLQQIPNKTTKKISFPFKISSGRGDIREIIFDSDAITITTAHKRMHWKIAQLRKVQFQQTYHEIKGQRGFNMIPDDYHAVQLLTLSFHTGDNFIFGAEQTEQFGCSPERLALILRWLYPDKFFSNVYGKLVNKAQQLQDQAEAHLAWGDKLRREGQYEQAIDEYAAAIDLNSEHRAYKHEIGNLLFILERYDEAAIAYRKMLTFFPNHKPSWERLSQCLFQLGQNKEAEEALAHISVQHKG